ncbi:hypothetical protein [Rossellomorea marisflavi]|uniref:hypothetical protein n=1 Tax=Rossellomorea marisflavi TaxID=189381 RepID=UPI0012E853BE|nr:hypothetical protein [Rossellomorea marisflavi]
MKVGWRERKDGFVPFRCGRPLSGGEWVELPRACGISPALYSLWSRPASAALHFLVKMG